MSSADNRPDVRIDGQRIHLRSVRLEDASGPYLRWMNDPEVTRYLESRYQAHSDADLREFIAGCRANPDVVFLAIVLNTSARHIGNIKLGPINHRHSLGDIGIILGEKDCWGAGYATEAIALLTEYAFSELGLHKVTAGCYDENVGSARAFLKAGFEQEGLRRAHTLCEGRFVDNLLFGRINPHWSGPAH